MPAKNNTLRRKKRSRKLREKKRKRSRRGRKRGGKAKTRRQQSRNDTPLERVLSRAKRDTPLERVLSRAKRDTPLDRVLSRAKRVKPFKVIATYENTKEGMRKLKESAPKLIKKGEEEFKRLNIKFKKSPERIAFEKKAKKLGVPMLGPMYMIIPSILPRVMNPPRQKTMIGGRKKTRRQKTMIRRRKKTRRQRGGAKWACPACTHQNEGSHTFCLRCLTDRPRGGAAAAGGAAGATWACPQCTFDNPLSRRSCEMCRTRRPRGGAAAAPGGAAADGGGGGGAPAAPAAGTGPWGNQGLPAADTAYGRRRGRGLHAGPLHLDLNDPMACRFGTPPTKASCRVCRGTGRGDRRDAAAGRGGVRTTQLKLCVIPLHEPPAREHIRHLLRGRDIRTVYNMTDPTNARLILASMGFIHGHGGIAGAGIYSCENLSHCLHKALARLGQVPRRIERELGGRAGTCELGVIFRCSVVMGRRWRICVPCMNVGIAAMVRALYPRANTGGAHWRASRGGIVYGGGPANLLGPAVAAAKYVMTEGPTVASHLMSGNTLLTMASGSAGCVGRGRCQHRHNGAFDSIHLIRYGEGDEIIVYDQQQFLQTHARMVIMPTAYKKRFRYTLNASLQGAPGFPAPEMGNGSGCLFYGEWVDVGRLRSNDAMLSQFLQANMSANTLFYPINRDHPNVPMQRENVRPFTLAQARGSGFRLATTADVQARMQAARAAGWGGVMPAGFPLLPAARPGLAGLFGGPMPVAGGGGLFGGGGGGFGGVGGGLFAVAAPPAGGGAAAAGVTPARTARFLQGFRGPLPPAAPAGGGAGAAAAGGAAGVLPALLRARAVPAGGGAGAAAAGGGGGGGGWPKTQAQLNSDCGRLMLASAGTPPGTGPANMLCKYNCARGAGTLDQILAHEAATEACARAAGDVPHSLYCPVV